MQRCLLLSTVLAITASIVYGGAPSAGDCGPTSVAGVPGCWGTPGCAYVIASDLGPGAACPFDYCNCGGINVQLLPETLSGTPTIGCASWTTQPVADNCPTIAPTIPSSSLGTFPFLNSTTPIVSPTSQPPPLPQGGTIVTASDGTQVVTETFVPTTYSQFATVTTVITTVVVDSEGNDVTEVIGPSGVGWTPLNQPDSAPGVSVPSVPPSISPSISPSAPPTALSDPQLSGQLGQTVVTDTIGSQTVTETFVPTTVSEFISLASTITVTTTNAQSVSETLVIGPGGLAWTPLSQAPSGVPELPPPPTPPSNTNAVSATQSGNTPTITSAPSTTPPSSSVTSAEPQSSVSDAFDTVQTETTITVGNTVLHYSKETIQSLTTVTAPTTITTPVAQTNKDGSQFTVSAAVIIVGPGGTWWNGGSGGFGIQGPSCIWPFCPPGGGGDVGGGGSGNNPSDPNTPGSPEEPSDPTEDDDDNSSKTQTSQDTSTSSSTSSTCASSTVSDCTVVCSTPASVTTQSCTTSCSSAYAACSATGTTVTSSASGTPSGQPCSPSCSACNAAPVRLKMPRRGLAEHALKRPTMKKRVLKSPADYGGDVANFLLSEYAFAEWLNINGASGSAISTGFGRSLIDKKYDAAIHGLYGCTSVVVASNSAMWISHFWEIPSFRAKPENWGQPRTDPDISNFNDHVINQMQNGGPDIPGLQQYTAQGGHFSAAENPVWAIVTPRAFSGVEGQYRYDPEVSAIKEVLGNLFPGVPEVVIDYVARSDDVSQTTTPSGKVLFQYDPFQSIISDPTDTCTVYQQAMFRVWVEDRPQPVLQQGWTAKTQQLITDFSAHASSKRKRDSAACPLPSSLPEAARATGGPDLVISRPPDADETHGVTIGASAGPTATTSSDNGSSAGPTATTSSGNESPNCMADGAPWMSPTSYCDCGPSATYPTIAPTDGATTANCAYTSLPSSTIQPVSTSSAPTNIPGQGGVPGCNLELAADQGLPSGSSDFCNCGGVTASVLVTTISGTASSNCNYPTVPPGGFNPLPSTSEAAPTPSPSPSPPPKPTVGPIQCAAYVDSYDDCWNDIHADSVEGCAKAMAAQIPGDMVTADSHNITQVYREGGGSKGVTYMMNIGWIPGCTTYESMVPDNPLGKSGDPPDVSISYTTIIKNTYYQCTGNHGLGGYSDVGCLRYGFYPNNVKGVFAAPPHPENFWKQYPNICNA